MSEPILVSLSSTGERQTLSLTDLQELSSAKGSVYTVLDDVSQEVPDNLSLKRKGNALEIEVDGDVVAQIDDFYTEGMDATFSVDGSLAASGPVMSASPVAGEQGLVWSAAEGAAASVGGISNMALAALGFGGVALVGESISDDDLTQPVAPPTVSTVPDTTAPTVAITDDTAATATGDVTYTFTFSEDVTGFTADDVTVAGGTKGTLTGSGSVYSLVVTPTANSMADITVDVAASVAMDAASNNNTAATQSVQAVNTDVTPPTVTVTDDTAATATGDVTYTFTFSEDVTGFTADDVTVAGGTKGALTGSGSVYSLVVTPTANSMADITVDVAASVAMDAASNNNTAATQSVQAVNTDVTPPTVAITDDTAATATGDVTYTFTFSETVTGFTADDVTVAGGTKGTFSGTGSVYSLVVTPTANSMADITVDVAASVAMDAASNNNTAATQSVQAVNTDVTPPTVAITDDTAATATGDVTYTFTFSEDVTGFTAADVTVAGGTKGALTGSGSVYSLVVTPATNSTTDITVDVAASVAMDAGSNNNTAATQSVQAVNTDVTPPTVMITDDTAATATGDVTYTFTFSEDVTGFTAADVTVAGGTKGTLTGSGAVYSLVVTPATNSTTDITVDVAASVAVDAGNNDNTVATQSVQAVNTDVTPPTVVITDDTVGTATSDVTYTFTFSEDVTGFTAADVTVAGGTKGTLTGSGSVYSLVVTPASNSTTGITVDVAAGVAQDIGLNDNTIAIQSAQIVDTVAPTLSSTSPTDNATEVALGDNIVMVFSENIALGTGNIVITGGAEVITIDVASHGGQLVVSGGQLTINPSSDLLNTGTTYNVQMAAGVITDEAGNDYAGIADATSFDFVTETETTQVVFDLTTGLSSDTGGQAFLAGVTYDIYIKVDSTAGNVGMQVGENWASAGNLGADDRIILVGTGAPIQGGGPASVDNILTAFNSNTWISSGVGFQVFNIAQGGFVVRFGTASTDSIDLWTGAWGSNPNLGETVLANVYLSTMPTSVSMPV